MWRFTLISRTAVESEIEEPRGWEDITVEMKRDDNWHGIFFGYSFNSLEFHGDGFLLIKEEYDEYGVSGQMQLRIEFQCSQGNPYDEFYTGQLRFAEYKDNCGDDCYATIGLEDTGDVMMVRNNYEQTVDINSNIAFDQETVLSDYDKLNFDLEVPSRGLLQVSEGLNTEAQSIELTTYPPWGNITPNGTTGIVQGTILPITSVQNLTEIQDTNINAGPYWDSEVTFGNASKSPPPSFIWVTPGGTLRCAPQTFSMHMRIKGNLTDVTVATRSVNLNLVVRVGPDQVNNQVVYSQQLASYAGSTPETRISTFDFTFDSDFNLNVGDNIWPFLFISYAKTSSAALQSVKVNFDAETEIRFSAISKCEPSTSKANMINEAFSRVVEAITNDGIRFYSTLLGRTDSQPYAIPQNTCQGLFSITNGLNVRRRLLVDNTAPGFFLSLKQLFDQQNSLWHTGMTIEPDPNREGFNRLRVEDWRYFYQSDVAIQFLYATKVSRAVDSSRLFNKLTVGFNKWQAAETTGLNEYMTKRTYRVNINTITQELNVSTDLILSPYTIEITRRLDQTTEDWQYDNDTFGFYLTSDGSGEYHVTTFSENASDISNITDAQSSYNAIRSPARIAMSWFGYVMQGVRHLQDTTKLIFANGEANYIAKYYTNQCGIEAATLSESEDIDLFDFEDSNNARPVTYPDLVTFEHPLNYNIFKRLKDSPATKYKQVMVSCNGNEIYGWIKSISYRPNEGLANVTIIPVNDSQVPGPPPPEPCSAEVSVVTATINSDLTATIDFTESVAGAESWTIVVTKNGVAYSTFTTADHPFTLTGLADANYQVTVIPHCANGDVGANYGTVAFTVATPQLTIELYATWQSTPSGLVKMMLHASPVGGTWSQAVSFRFGQCFGNGYCNGYPGSVNPGTYGTISAANAQSGEVTAVSGGNTTAGDVVTSVTIFNIVSISPVVIKKRAGQTWTLNQL